jgi:glucose/mannose-6-phosphate isomerase
MEKDIPKSMIYNQVRDFPEQIEDALNAEKVDLPESSEICICGMGNSALAGDVLSDYINESSGIPISVIRGIELPGWVGKNTTVIAISYSGDTREVLIVYDEACRRGSKTICISAGGELTSKCRSNGGILFEVPSGLQSRGAFGYLLGYLAVILEQMGISDSATELRRLLPELKKQRDKLTGPKNTLVEDIAETLLGKIPVIYSLTNMRSSAIRWKTQINENSKFLSFCGSIPEFNHNEIVGWTAEGNNNAAIFMPVILCDDDASEMVKCMTNTSISTLEDSLNIVSYHVSGSNNLEKNLKCVILGDLVSLKLADLRNTDPCIDRPVKDVNSLIIIDDKE